MIESSDFHNKDTKWYNNMSGNFCGFMKSIS